MIDGLLFAFTCVAVLGCGLIAGVFFAFSAFVMDALARLSPAHGIAAMQSINIVVINPLFLGAFLGTAAACALLAVASLLMWHAPGAIWLLTGSVLYLVGTILVTLMCHVPRNQTLARVEPTSAEAARLWDSYVAGWTAWNHLRTTASLAAAAALMMALR